MSRQFILTQILFGAIVLATTLGHSDDRVIYGVDTRLDLYQVSDVRRLALADSTVALVSTNDVKDVNGTSYLNLEPYATSQGTPLCPTERFYNQSLAAFCSGFLVAPNVIATAGHCIHTDSGDMNDCSMTKIVFGFSIDSAQGSTPQSVPTSEVYSCKKIIRREETPDAQDYAVIELDRNVTNHMPLKMRQSGDPLMSDQLMVIGHPEGLPTKIADGADIRVIEPSFIQASLDTYDGNSGSAVFNTRTLEVEGILVRGERDFILHNGCLISNVCPQNGCRGEDSTRVSYVIDALKSN